MNPNPTAIDLVALVRRYKALGGTRLVLINAAEEAPEVIACIALIAEAEPLAWDPPREYVAAALGDGVAHTVPGIYELRVDGVCVQVWGVARPTTYTDDPTRSAWRPRMEAEERAGVLLLDAAGMKRPRKSRAA